MFAAVEQECKFQLACNAGTRGPVYREANARFLAALFSVTPTVSVSL